MSDRCGADCTPCLSQETKSCSPRFEDPECGAGLFSHLDQCDAHSYPSPPMSNPPSPPRLPQEQPASLLREPRVTTSATTRIATPSSMPVTAAIGPAYGSPFYAPTEPVPYSHTRITTTISQNAQASPVFSTIQSQQHLGSHAAFLSRTEDPPAGQPSVQSGGRKPRAHVASACINCKRAHLSCDINRPCTRCVSSGKQDSCYDVQHKKRGRPRLREEGSFKVGRMVPESASTSALSSHEPILGPRPMATPRPRRAESFRSLRSQDSEASGTATSPTYPYPPPPTATATSFEYSGASNIIDYEVPTAYLDLDLVIIKANSSFCQIMSISAHGHAGIPLSELSVPVDGQTFEAIRADLRLERERRDPAYMPPIIQPDQDPLSGASLVDIDRFTQGSDERTYIWTQARSSYIGEHFPVRMRLAKAHTYFAALTLPSFRPRLAPELALPVPSLPSSASEQYTTSRHVATQSAPAAAHAPPLSAPVRMPGHQSTRSYPPPQPPLPYQQQMQRSRSAQRLIQAPQSYVYPGQQSAASTPRLSAAVPPADTELFAPRSRPRELPPGHDNIPRTGIQLPPILGGTAPFPATSASARAEALSTPDTWSIHAAAAPRSGDTSADDRPSTPRSPRKRRKLDLGDVLH